LQTDRRANSKGSSWLVSLDKFSVGFFCIAGVMSGLLSTV